LGASGSIGSVSARLLAMTFDEVYLAGRTLSKLDELKASILKETPDAKVFTTVDYNELLGDMDMIVTSTSGAGKEILDIMKVKPGCVITDVARPLDLPASDVAKRPDVLVIESGEIDLPTKVKGLKSIGLPPNVVYACLAETIVLALEGRFEVFTVGRDTEWEKVKDHLQAGPQARHEAGRHFGRQRPVLRRSHCQGGDIGQKGAPDLERTAAPPKQHRPKQRPPACTRQLPRKPLPKLHGHLPTRCSEKGCQSQSSGTQNSAATKAPAKKAADQKSACGPSRSPANRLPTHRRRLAAQRGRPQPQKGAWWRLFSWAPRYTLAP
jgi:hypothetical protein